MLLKSADNKESQIEILNNLLKHGKIPAKSKQAIEKELWSIKTGIATENQAAFEIDFYFGHSKNLIVLHDLRLEIDGRVAQIDHVLMNRCMEVFVLETKTFGSGLSINENGEFSTSYEGREVGIPSPLEQNTRHVAVLRDAFKAIGLPTRLGVTIQPSFHPVVLVSPRAVVRRPASSKIDSTSVIKLDQFSSWYNEKLDDTKLSDVFGAFKICSFDTIKALGEKLVALHRPGRTDYIRKFDLAGSLLKKDLPSTVRFPIPPMGKVQQPYVNSNQKHLCAACGQTIPVVVADFCLKNRTRFGGKTFCRPCQGKL